MRTYVVKVVTYEFVTVEAESEKEKIKLLLKFIENIKDSVGTFEFCKALFETGMTQEEQKGILGILQENK